MTEQENEANVLACYLLIPQKQFEQDMKQEISFEDNEIINTLCKKYQVTQSVLLFRIKLYFKDEYRK